MPVPTPLAHIFDFAKNADAHREQMAKGVEVAAQDSLAWTTFGNKLAELIDKLQSLPGFGPLSNLTNLPEVEPGVFGYSAEVPRHGVNGEEMIGHLTALMRDSRAIGAAYEAAGHRLAAAVTEPAV